MRQVTKNTSIGLGYQFDYHWHISDFNTENGVASDMQVYDSVNRFSYLNSSSSGLSLNFLYDSRNNANNPREGIYFNVQFRANLKALAGSTNYNSMIVDFRKYFRLPTQWYLELACWGYLWVTLNGTPPYLDLPSTGWDMFNNTGRGYALGRFRGTNMIYGEAELRFGILRSGLLGGAVFANLESLSQWPSNNFGAFQPGVGLGIRIKLNKRTNTNSAIDYGFGTGGSRGFATNLNEVF
jgi:outer membrane protein assembly factor BamA